MPQVPQEKRVRRKKERKREKKRRRTSDAALCYAYELPLAQDVGFFIGEATVLVFSWNSPLAAVSRRQLPISYRLLLRLHRNSLAMTVVEKRRWTYALCNKDTGCSCVGGDTMSNRVWFAWHVIALKRCTGQAFLHHDFTNFPNFSNPTPGSVKNNGGAVGAAVPCPTVYLSKDEVAVLFLRANR